MDFFEFKTWLKENGYTFDLEGWSGCIKDTIIVKKDDKQVYINPYEPDVEYADYVEDIKAGRPGGDM